MAESVREYAASAGYTDSTDTAFIQDIAVLLKESEGLTLYLAGRVTDLIATASHTGHPDRPQQSGDSGHSGYSQHPPSRADTPSTSGRQVTPLQASNIQSPSFPHPPQTVTQLSSN
jgi:hypothetical protein